ncbi:MAG: CHASE2 domain-containing protein, partial [Desulfocucumaceae bacterium]
MKVKAILTRYGISVTIWSFVVVLATLGFFQEYENMFYDFWFRLRGEAPPGESIVIIGEDDASYAKLGAPIPRIAHAKLLEQLKDARIVAFDIMFQNKRQPEEDEAFARAIKNQGRVFLACSFSFGKDEEGYIDTAPILPYMDFLKVSRGVGYINMNTDTDNTVRRVMPVIEYNKRLAPSFSLAITLLSQGMNPNKLQYENGVLKTPDGKFAIPMDLKKPEYMLNFWGPQGSFKTYSYVDVIEGKHGPEAFRDKIVLIGPTSAFDHDYFDIPFTRSNMVLKGSLPTPGVEIHAAAINTFLTNSRYTSASRQINLVIMLLAGIIVYLAAYKRGAWIGLAGFLATAVILVSCSYLAWLHFRYWINLAAPLILIVITYIGLTTENFIREQLEKKRTRAVFGRYVSPQVVSQLLDQPEMMS